MTRALLLLCLGHPPYNCDFCGSRVRGDVCDRHPAASADRVRLLDRFNGMRVLRYLAVPAVVMLTGCGPSGEPRESFKGCAHHSINRTDGDLRDCGER